MRNNLENIELIEKYLNGELTIDEKLIVEEKLKSDQDFKILLNTQQDLYNAINRVALRKEIKNVVKSTRGGSGLNKWIIGALIIIVFGASLFYFSNRSEQVSISTTPSILKADAPQKEKTDPPTVYDSTKKEAAPAYPVVKQNVAYLPPLNSQGSVILKDSIDKKAVPVEEIEQCPMAFTDRNFIVPFASYNFKAEIGGSFTDRRSGSIITIPSGILDNPNGKQVKGEVTLHYREYRDAADIAYSGIPMTYKQDDSIYNFNSAGMFELYILQGQDSLVVKRGKAVRVDFVMTQEILGTAFYKLDNKMNNWNEIGKIQSENQVKDSVSFLDITMIGAPEEKGRIGEEFMQDAVAQPPVFFVNSDRRNNSLLANGVNKGHTYPSLVKGLICKDFGVYNCDQIYNIGKVIHVNPTFKDSLGKIIVKQNVLTLIDLNYNGSFSFDPHNIFQMNPKAKNVLLLFTTDNKVFSYSEADFNSTSPMGAGRHDFVMKDISEKVTNTEDLRKYLGLTK